METLTKQEFTKKTSKESYRGTYLNLYHLGRIGLEPLSFSE